MRLCLKKNVYADYMNNIISKSKLKCEWTKEDYLFFSSTLINTTNHILEF